MDGWMNLSSIYLSSVIYLSSIIIYPSIHPSIYLIICWSFIYLGRESFSSNPLLVFYPYEWCCLCKNLTGFQIPLYNEMFIISGLLMLTLQITYLHMCVWMFACICVSVIKTILRGIWRHDGTLRSQYPGWILALLFNSNFTLNKWIKISVL